MGKEDLNNPDSRNKLINAVYGHNVGSSTSQESGVPVGYFIFNKGKATWMLSENSQALTDAYSESGDGFFLETLTLIIIRQLHRTLCCIWLILVM